MAFGALLGGLTSLPLMALLYLGQQFASVPFVPFDLFDWLARVLPGGVVTAGIDAMVSVIAALNLGPTSETAKLIEQIIALGIMVAGGMLLGAIIARVLQGGGWLGRQIGSIGGTIAFLLILAVEFALGNARTSTGALALLGMLIVGWGALLGMLLCARVFGGQRAAMSAADRANRRALLLKIAGGSVVMSLGGWWLGSVVNARNRGLGADQPLTELGLETPAGTPLPQATPPVPERAEVSPAPGARPEVTPNEAFYRIDINIRPLRIDGEAWQLEVAGLFDRPGPLALAELIALPAVTQPITLSCISNPIGGDLIGTSYWSGVRLRDLLERLGLRPEVQALAIQAADGFFESVMMRDMLDPRTLLVYGMNGRTLPAEHGYPLRVYIPNRYGMKQPKWITRIEAVSSLEPGYWVARGWSAEARPHIISIIDTVARDQVADGRVPIGGIAWAGDRGIQQVEVQVDGGEWAVATLLMPPVSPLTWVLWRYDWPRSAGRHTFRVRATDGAGAPQIEQATDPHPNGATGYHAVTATI